MPWCGDSTGHRPELQVDGGGRRSELHAFFISTGTFFLGDEANKHELRSVL